MNTDHQPARAEVGDPLRVIAQTLQMQLFAHRYRTDAMHLGALAAVAALGLFLLQAGRSWFLAGQNASLAVVTIVQLVLCVTHHLDYRMHQAVLAVLGWDGCEARRDAHRSDVDCELRVALAAAHGTILRTMWWQTRLRTASRAFVRLSLLLAVGHAAQSVADRLP